MSTTAKLRERLDSDSGEFAKSWQPSPGEALIGTILRYDRATTRRGEEALIVIVRDEEHDEDRSVWLLHHVLLREFAEQRPKVGETIGLKYFGKDPEKGYHRWSLYRATTGSSELPNFAKYVGGDAGNVEERDWSLAGDDEAPF